MSIIQSIIFNVKYWTIQKAIKWLQDENRKAIKLDITENYLRFRQISPTTLKKKGFTHYITKDLNNGIELIIAIKPNLSGNSPIRKSHV
jgi:recombinational DNA repair protein RecR